MHRITVIASPQLLPPSLACTHARCRQQCQIPHKMLPKAELQPRVVLNKPQILGEKHKAASQLPWFPSLPGVTIGRAAQQHADTLAAVAAPKQGPRARNAAPEAIRT